MMSPKRFPRSMAKTIVDPQPPAPQFTPPPTALADALIKVLPPPDVEEVKAIAHPLDNPFAPRPPRVRHDKRPPPKVEIVKRRRIGQPVSGRAGLAQHMNGESKF